MWKGKQLLPPQLRSDVDEADGGQLEGVPPSRFALQRYLHVVEAARDDSSNLSLQKVTGKLDSTELDTSCAILIWDSSVCLGEDFLEAVLL